MLGQEKQYLLKYELDDSANLNNLHNYFNFFVNGAGKSGGFLSYLYDQIDTLGFQEVLNVLNTICNHSYFSSIKNEVEGSLDKSKLKKFVLILVEELKQNKKIKFNDHYYKFCKASEHLNNLTELLIEEGEVSLAILNSHIKSSFSPELVDHNIDNRYRVVNSFLALMVSFIKKFDSDDFDFVEEFSRLIMTDSFGLAIVPYISNCIDILSKDKLLTLTSKQNQYWIDWTSTVGNKMGFKLNGTDNIEKLKKVLNELFAYCSNKAEVKFSFDQFKNSLPSDFDDPFNNKLKSLLVFAQLIVSDSSVTSNQVAIKTLLNSTIYL